MIRPRALLRQWHVGVQNDTDFLCLAAHDESRNVSQTHRHLLGDAGDSPYGARMLRLAQNGIQLDHYVVENDAE